MYNTLWMRESKVMKQKLFLIPEVSLPLTLVLLLLLMLTGGGCVMPEAMPQANADINRLRQENQVQLRQLARFRADLEQLREENMKVQARLEQQQELINTLVRQLQQVDRQVAGQSSSAAVAALEQRLAALQNALQAESQAREKAIRDVIQTVSQEISTAVNSLRQSAPRTGGGAPTGRGVQGEYTVMRGDTLGAIARAFGIPVEALKQANNMQNDLIIEGQKLLIPKP